jgi:hypothetical protein
LLHALLRLYFADIRVEEWTPSYGGGSSRMDFLLKGHDIVVEAKMTRKGLTAKDVSEQLIIDAAKYRQHPGTAMGPCGTSLVRALRCFVALECAFRRFFGSYPRGENRRTLPDNGLLLPCAFTPNASLIAAFWSFLDSRLNEEETCPLETCNFSIDRCNDF